MKSLQEQRKIIQNFIQEELLKRVGDEETLEDEGYTYNPFWIEVHVSYKHFGGGSNGCRLFTVQGHLTPNGKVYELKAY
jgi:hypothetical protein